MDAQKDAIYNSANATAKERVKALFVVHRIAEKEGIRVEQTEMTARLQSMNQKQVEWDSGTTGMGVLVGDSLMFERGEPVSSDEHLGHIHGMGIQPLEMEGSPVVLRSIAVASEPQGPPILQATAFSLDTASPRVGIPAKIMVFTLAFGADVCVLILVAIREMLLPVQLFSGMAVFLALNLWMAKWLKEPLLYWALGLSLLFALVHTVFPLVLGRLKPGCKP